MADVQHSEIQHADTHEPKWITLATIADTGKVITPSSDEDGESVLRFLTLDDIAAGQASTARFGLKDSTDTSKLVAFNLAGVSAATTRTWAFPDASSTFVGTDATQTLTNKRVTKRVVTLTDAATIAVNSDTTDQGNVTLTDNRTLGNPTGTPTDGQVLVIRVRQDAAAGRTLAYDTAYRFSGASAPTVTNTANETTYLTFVYHAGDAKWDCIGTTLDIRT